MQNLSEITQKASQYYQQALGFQPRRTKLQILTKEEWQCFCAKFNLNQNSKGIFLPRNLIAYLLEDSECLALNLFHEYFGHGLFFEYSGQGKFLEKLERRLLKEEKREFKGRQFSQSELQEFRKQNPNFRLLRRKREEFLELSELFAIWTEHFLSDIFGIKKDFETKYNKVPEETKRKLEQMVKFQQEWGEVALFYKLGMPKYYDAEKIKELIIIKNFKEKIESISLALVYGSKKPYSDVDLFVVSSKIPNFTSEWLDVYSITPEEFEYLVSVFDIAVADPLLTGELAFGDVNYLEQKRRQLQEQPITQESIYYNLIKAKQQRILAKMHPANSKEYKRGSSYAETYLKNALALKQGNRKLTRISLVNL